MSSIFLKYMLAISIWVIQSSAVAQTEIEKKLEISRFAIEAPIIALNGVPFTLKINAVNQEDGTVKSFSDTIQVTGLTVKDDTGVSDLQTLILQQGTVTLDNAILEGNGNHLLNVNFSGLTSEVTIRTVPGILSLLPPILAITLAFLTRQVLIALFSGVWLGALFIYNYNPIAGFLRTIDTFIVNSATDTNNAAVLIFSLTLGGMVGVISKSGGTKGIVQKLSKYANHPRGGQLATWGMGLLIFFDDYANSLVVGNTMRPFTDRLRISREKLSYIVDSTAAPVASIALISTWIGYQIGLIDQVFGNLNLNLNPYTSFLESIPFATYSILAIVFVFLIGFTLRDFGSMRAAENRAVLSGKVLRDGAQPITDSTALDTTADEGTPLRWYNALIPICTVIVVTLLGLYVDGKMTLGEASATAHLGEIFGAADSFKILMWAAFTGLLAACILALSQRILTMNETMEATVNGYKSMFLAAMILVLAWSIGGVCGQLNTAGYVISLTKDILSPHLIPLVTFLVSAFIAFSTGTSWATMAILTPIVIPMSYQLPQEAGLAAGLNHQILIATIGSVLSGAVLGDHCSPISDTTILSSMASAADHVDHVRTQLPYAVVVGIVACLVGYLPSGWGFSSWLSLVLGAGILVGVIFLLGKKTRPNMSN